MKLLVVIMVGAALYAAASQAVRAAPAAINGSQRNIPVAYSVDVVVVGGSTGAVSAAVAAAKKGASVFLAQRYPYLGEDMTASLRLWLDEGEEPAGELARAIFAPTRTDSLPADIDIAGMIPISYKADLPSAPKHKDGGRGLTDGKWGSATGESVQYDGDVNITVDLDKAQEVEKACVMAYHARDFRIDSVTAFVSDDAKTWKEVGKVTNKEFEQSSVTEPALALIVPIKRSARHLKLSVQRAEGSKRVLLGEVLVFKPTPAKAPAPDAEKPKPKPYAQRATPFHVKKTLDDALVKAGVGFLFGCYATDVLRDADGKPCGIVMANRAGRQAVLAKVVIDATDRANVARMAGAKFRPYPAGTHTFQRVVIGGEVRAGANLSARKVGQPWLGTGRNKQGGSSGAYDVIEYTLKIPMKDAGFASFALADQVARDLTYDPGQQFTSDGLFEVPPDAMHGRKAVESAVRTNPDPAPEQRSAQRTLLDACRPADVERMYVLGGCVDVPREDAARLLRPLALMALGERIGEAAAAEAKALPKPRGVHVPGAAAAGALPGDVGEGLSGPRGVGPAQGEKGDIQLFRGGKVDCPLFPPATIPQLAHALPVLGEYDVVVIGGGTGGAPAGIAAARSGVGRKTLVVEYQYGLGGVGTLGAISSYYHGYRGGFTAEVPGSNNWVIEQRMEWWRSELRKAGAEVWFGAVGCGAVVDGKRVTGAVVATPQGRGVVLAKVVIDGTGNADVAAAAGADCIYTDGSTVAVQGTGLPPRRLGASYANTDFTIVDETDMVDTWQVYVYAKHKYAGQNPFDMGKLIDTRERRRVGGDFTLSILDQANGRTYPDTVAIAATNYDTHGYTIHPLFELSHPGHERNFRCYIPYRCLLPKGIDGLLVIGLGISAHRDSVPLIRMQPDVQNLGYAAGCAAMMAATAGKPTRQIDLKALQKHLVEVKCVPQSVLSDKDSYPMSASQIADAVRSAANNYEGSSVILAHPKQALPLVKEAYAQAATKEHRLIYGHILALLGDGSGMEAILEAVNAAGELGPGWQYTGMGQFGGNMSRLDKLMVALGRIGDVRATPAILQKLRLLKLTDPFSHFRAVAAALEGLKDPAAAAALAELLSKPGMSGHAVATIDQAIKRRGTITNPNDNSQRSEALRELLLARALYRCGDKDGLGKRILLEYTRDLRGHLARHAQAVLRD